MKMVKDTSAAFSAGPFHLGCYGISTPNFFYEIGLNDFGDYDFSFIICQLVSWFVFVVCFIGAYRLR
jgi:hypothetical protein